MTFEQSTDEQSTVIEIKRSILWGLWKQEILFEGKYSLFANLVEKLKWRK